ncbi:16248_t:CDS:2 [Entrophospora sp. SA101]|nr:3030_t:CDS:2 [Entrophospora candida]CAH1763501.1 844_t:CDS:2 [Entrophospora sp. SA101]CAG8530977.1 3455_t:CDS:2 [Entrophospora candida]CAJ0638163.1 1140_t:CDS:2 [Entrophospora sp. SA101]CAJ0766738.1 16248_t:CDS:2 [Entrophospora sp. SA101]
MSQSIGKNCNELKEKYDACFNWWYSENFLKGNPNPDCNELFQQYKECVKNAVKNKQIDKILGEARKDDPLASLMTEN